MSSRISIQDPCFPEISNSEHRILASCVRTAKKTVVWFGRKLSHINESTCSVGFWAFASLCTEKAASASWDHPILFPIATSVHLYSVVQLVNSIRKSRLPGDMQSQTKGPQPQTLPRVEQKPSGEKEISNSPIRTIKANHTRHFKSGKDAWDFLQEWQKRARQSNVSQEGLPCTIS